MTFRLRIAAWVVLSCLTVISVMIVTAYMHLEEELRRGHEDPTHPQYADWKLHNSYSEEEIDDILGELLENWIQVAVPMVLVSLGAGLLLARRSLRPVHHINRQIDRMQPDSLHGGIVIPEADRSFADLVNHLNSLLDRAGTAYQEMAGFSARVAHELRTPLMLLRLRVEHAPEGMPPAFQQDLQDELARLSRFVERSLLSAKAAQGALKPTCKPLCLSELVRDVTEDYQFLAAEHGHSMRMEIVPDIQVEADSDLLRQALHGLLENAVSYAKSTILVECGMESGHPVLRIQNDRDGVTMATAGLGLGLRLVRGICKASSLDFKTEESDHEFRASICFPAGKTTS